MYWTSASSLETFGRFGGRGCRVIRRTDERDSDAENVQWCKLITKHPRRDSDCGNLFEDTSNTHRNHPCTLDDTGQQSRYVREEKRNLDVDTH